MRLPPEITPLRRRALLLVGLVVVAIGAIHVRLFQLQVLEGGSWQSLAENNRLRSMPLAARRGRIYDRTGLVLADNTPSFDLLVFPDETPSLQETALFLASNGIVGTDRISQDLRRRSRGSLAPILVAEGLTWEEVARVRSHQTEHPELVIVDGFRRHYPYGALTAHAIGHLRLPTRAELAADPEVTPDSLLGATGVEEMMNATLSGHRGFRRMVVSAVGRQLGVVEERRAREGHDITITLDVGLQRAAAEALGAKFGAVAVVEAETGAVRALYSSPSFDPNVFSRRLSSDEWAGLRDDPEHPLQDRCIAGAYPPASTIKPFLALAGLATRLVSPRQAIECRGGVVLHGRTFHCWKRSGHGRVALERSLEVSCDTYYYLLGQRLGIQGIASWLGRFGFGRPTGIGLAGETAGLIGTPEWARRVRGHPWYPGTTVSVSIGQGPLLVTPLQLAAAYAPLANGGKMVRPYLVETGRPSLRTLELGEANLDAVRHGLWRVTHGAKGTARSLAGLPVSGKTGTAQVVRLREGIKSEELERRLRHHALFVGWAPELAPRLVVAVVVEHGGSGASAAAPVAGKVFTAALGPL